MTTAVARELRPGSTFYRPHHDYFKRWRLLAVIACSSTSLTCIDEYGYQFVVMLSSSHFFASCHINQPAGATDPEALLNHLRKTGKLA